MNGMDVTQATVSRDIKELRLVKVLESPGIQICCHGTHRLRYVRAIVSCIL